MQLCILLLGNFLEKYNNVRNDLWVLIMKDSRYNFIFLDNNNEHASNIVYNSRSGAMVLLDAETMSAFDDFRESGLVFADKNIFDELVRCGFIVDDNLNEIGEIQFSLLRSRFATSSLGLVIAPTMDCNFRCTYCFEQGQLHNVHMDDTIATKLIDFVAKKANMLERLNVFWYGGEPLLAIERVESLSKELINICRNNKIRYSASIVTNGYYYSPEIAERLKACSVGVVQITLDGSKEIHDQRRFLEDGSGTFDIIINNLKLTKGILPVTLRVNVDTDNYIQGDEVASILKNEGVYGDVLPYLAQVNSANDTLKQSRCLSNQQFSKINLKYMIDGKTPIMTFYPKPKGNFCISDFTNGFVIDPYGDMYKCFADIGREDKKVCSLLDEHIDFSPIMHDYVLHDPTLVDRCKSCKLLPICLGGCPHLRMNNIDNCSQFKYSINEYLLECAKFLQNDKHISVQ